MDCTSTPLKHIYNKKFSCTRTKTESILTRYFNPKTGVQIKILEITNLKGETADILINYIIEILNKYKLSDKIFAFSGDNCNTKFGGSNRKGTKNVFSFLNKSLKNNICGIDCAAHVWHNAMQSSADTLPIDLKSIVPKQDFPVLSYIYTVRVENLKEFYDFANIEFKNILGSIKTCWLSLSPVITRIIDIFPASKSYFVTQDKCPTIIKLFFNDPFSLIWLNFLQSQLNFVSDTVKNEGDKISACDVAEELEVLCGKIRNRKNQNFWTSKIVLLLNDLKKQSMYDDKSFK
jgi:hypothetical protein